MPINLAESLKKRIGPIPAWGWGVGIGGAVLVVLFLRGSSLLSGGKSTDTSKTSDATDTSTVTTQSDGSSQKSSGSSDSSSSDNTALSDRIAALEKAAQDAKDAEQKKKDEASGKWPGDPGITWGGVPQGSEITTGDNGMPKIVTITSDKGAGGGSQMAANSNGSPTISLEDIGGIQIASPDTTPKPTVSTVKSNPIPMVPAAAGKAATSTSRQVGRPYHDSDTGNVVGL